MVGALAAAVLAISASSGFPKVFTDAFQSHPNHGRHGRHVTLSVSSPSSFAIDCPHFESCPGCVTNSNVSKIDSVQSAQRYFSSSSVQKHIRPAVDSVSNVSFYKIAVPSAATHWRTQAKLAISPSSTWSRNSQIHIGLYARNSHNVIAIPNCQVHHPSIQRAVQLLEQALLKARTPIYQHETNRHTINQLGCLKYVQLRVETSSNRVALTLVFQAENIKQCQPQLSRLLKELRSEVLSHKENHSQSNIPSSLWHSIGCHYHNLEGNAIFAREETRTSGWQLLEGPPYLLEHIPGSTPERGGKLYFSPRVFRQANLEGFGKVAQEVWEAVGRRTRKESPIGVCELYAGVGMLGLSVLLQYGVIGEKNQRQSSSSMYRLKWLRCSDENPENARCFELAVNTIPWHITGRYPKEGRDGKEKHGEKRMQNRNQLQSNGHSRPKQETKEIYLKDLMEGMSGSSQDAKTNKGNTYANGNSSIQPSQKVTYTVASATSALYKGQALGAEVLIVDPPRKGLDELVLQQLCLPYNSKQPQVDSAMLLSYLPQHQINWTNDVRTLIYVSCGLRHSFETVINYWVRKVAGQWRVLLGMYCFQGAIMWKMLWFLFDDELSIFQSTARSRELNIASPKAF